MNITCRLKKYVKTKKVIAVDNDQNAKIAQHDTEIKYLKDMLSGGFIKVEKKLDNLSELVRFLGNDHGQRIKSIEDSRGFFKENWYKILTTIIVLSTLAFGLVEWKKGNEESLRNNQITDVRQTQSIEELNNLVKKLSQKIEGKINQ